ncbi:DUF302 domain-containing protein [Bathymodiolus septemdierum thioautotrophic gill symbiont]|uniref:DUF302 domain-containing protein n=1 Tax=endosymbiont of Bathymodiolus septemdierum str. Myojin knoll TaxID=1303921 RepID=A0A0P0UQP4_9GAMM|nr:DUF302 domain-containing protein [Bathymodiolus septemdierum thioautotrophic gill symbiont]BAS67346.1 conserved hypothetical protein [endosymbiont of Bathymodiolus septemdierum str. Myojin knoll]
MSIIKSLLMIIGAIATYYMVSLQVQYGVTTKVISEMISPTLHPDAMAKVYMPMTNILLDTGDITMASIVRDKVDPEMSIEDIEEAMAEVVIERNIKDVGQLPLSEQVELQLDKKQRFLKIYQFCKPTTAMIMVDHSDAFSAYLPCRIALIEDKQGQKWLYSLNMDFMIYGGAPLPPALLELALEVKATMNAIQKAGAGIEIEDE